MKHLTACNADEPIAVRRAGVTLTEVLVSIVIMSIGIVLLATLLPISILRTAQATQLTHAVLLRNNAEAFIESNPFIIGNLQIPVNAGVNFAVVDPLGSFSGLPATLAGVSRTNGGAISRNAAEVLASLPDSWSPVFETTVSTYGATGISVPTTTSVNAMISGLRPRNAANATNARHRMLLFNGNGQFAAIRDLLTVSGGNSLQWQDTTTIEPGLPTGFIPARVRVEAQSLRFSWLMTAAKSWIPVSSADTPSSARWAAELDVAVFFNRSFKLQDETACAVTLLPGGKGLDGANGILGVDLDNDLTPNNAAELGWPGSDDNRTVNVDCGAYIPHLKKGGYMLETSLLKWYRIVEVVPPVSPSTLAQIVLDKDIRTAPNTAMTGVFMRGIVEVYSLGVRTGGQQ